MYIIYDCKTSKYLDYIWNVSRIDTAEQFWKACVDQILDYIVKR